MNGDRVVALTLISNTMSLTETIKGRIQKMKDFFDAPVVTPPVAPVVPPVQAPQLSGTPTPYTLTDGTAITINQAGTVPAVGDTVTVNGVPAPDGTHTLASGSSVTTVGGAITAIVEVTAPVTNDLSTQPPPAAAPVVITPAAPQFSIEELKSKVDGFATGTPEERIANLEIVAKALMLNCMGYELEKAQREATNAAAIEVYKTSLTNAELKLSAVNAEVEKHKKTITDLFELVEEIHLQPSAEPVTINPAKKEKFDRINKKNERLDRIAEHIKNNRAIA